jgi:hypothetical protein
LQFEGQHDEADKLIRQSKNGLISFSNFWIYANSEKKAKRGYSSDFYFKVSGHGGEKKDAINQQFEFYLNETLIEAKKIEVLIDELMEIGFVKKVYQLRKPYVFAKYNLENPLAIITMNNYTINYDDLELYKERID